MISRRLLRIKIMQILYAYYKSDEEGQINKFEKQLNHSTEKTYELYFLMFLLIIDLVKYAESRIDLARRKRRPTAEDLKPNTKFVDNRVIMQLAINNQLNRFIDEKGISWVNYPELIKKLFTRIEETQYFKQYMANDIDSYDWDKKLIVKILSEDILNFEPLYHALEEQSIFWNDDVEFTVSMVIKTIKGFRQSDGEYAQLMPLFKNEDDRNYAKTLFRKSILHKDEYIKLIDSFTMNWDVERIAFMDILIMQIAITELVEFPSIPVKVTLNEFIEVSKYYSTAKSSTFINGVLDKIIQKLRDEKKITKQGRGLIGEV
jgi:N utilization substance protein B